jgi:hypothetical protein
MDGDAGVWAKHRPRCSALWEFNEAINRCAKSTTVIFGDERTGDAF